MYRPKKKYIDPQHRELKIEGNQTEIGANCKRHPTSYLSGRAKCDIFGGDWKVKHYSASYLEKSDSRLLKPTEHLFCEHSATHQTNHNNILTGRIHC